MPGLKRRLLTIWCPIGSRVRVPLLPLWLPVKRPLQTGWAAVLTWLLRLVVLRSRPWVVRLLVVVPLLQTPIPVPRLAPLPARTGIPLVLLLRRLTRWNILVLSV